MSRLLRSTGAIAALTLMIAVQFLRGNPVSPEFVAAVAIIFALGD
jgi:hypothetical protein